jgi:hypothetical protein
MPWHTLHVERLPSWFCVRTVEQDRRNYEADSEARKTIQDTMLTVTAPIGVLEQPLSEILAL